MLRVGASSTEITPEGPVELTGYGYYLGRKTAKVGSELRTSAIALQSGDTTAALCSVDLLSMDLDTVDKVKAAVGKMLPDQPAPTLFISASHTHSGPGIHESIGIGDKDPGYIDHILVPRLAGTIAQAFANARDGEIGVENHDVGGVSFNRTGGDILDTRVSAIKFVNERQRIVGANFPCHPVVHGPKSALISSDYPGVARQVLQRETGADQTFWLTGFAGDVNPTTDPSLSAEQNSQKIGAVIGSMASVLQERIFTAASPLETLSTMVELPVNTDFELSVEEELEAFRAARNLPKTADLGPVEHWFREAQPIVNAYSNETLAVPLTVIKLGHVTFIGLGAEIYSSTGLDLQAAHPDLKIVPAMNTNEHQGYVPVEADYKMGINGNYAAANSSYIFGRKPLTPDSEAVLSATVSMHLDQLTQSA